MTDRKVEIVSRDGEDAHVTVTVTTNNGKTFTNHVDFFSGNTYCTCLGLKWCGREHIEPARAALEGAKS